ncbi:ankyrin repeat and EF-hand domain-containing protein 1-like isoform X3 [Convolutriloba macropyga]|uniref:ankyrin repeat and EF-hand domain-containing protein 1-like isoform X3 n=1 Tax=Convolutriloba macropyga TaxID=536237 RepID=UPI003F51DCF6
MQLIAKTRLEELQLRKLLDCIRTKNKEAIAKIITSGLPDLVNYIENDPEGIGAVHLCALENDWSTLQELLKAGASPNLQDGRGRTVAMIAAQYGHVQVMKLLDNDLRKVNMKLKDTEGRGVLFRCLSRTKRHAICAEIAIKRGADCNNSDFQGISVLYEGCENACETEDICVRLLEYGADPNAQTAVRMESPLHAAAQQGNMRVCRALIGAGAKVDLASRKKLTAAHFAAKAGHVEVLQLLAAHGANLDEQDLIGNTPMHYAAMSGQALCVKLLTYRLCMGSIKNRQGHLPNKIALLMKKEQQTKSAKKTFQQAAKFAKKATRLENNHKLDPSAIKPDELRLYDWVQEYQSDLLIQFNQVDTTATGLVDENAFYDVMEMHGPKFAPPEMYRKIYKLHDRENSGLIKYEEFIGGKKYVHKPYLRSQFLPKGLKSGKKKKGKKGKGGKKKKFKLAVPICTRDEGPRMPNGAPPANYIQQLVPVVDWSRFTRDNQSKHPIFDDSYWYMKDSGTAYVNLNTATRSGDVESMKKAIMLGKTHVDQRDKYYKTPLMAACRQGNVQMSRFLISLGADVNAKDNFFWTPLHFACNSGQLPIVQMLVDAGASINAQTMHKATPLMRAVETSRIEVVEFLLEKVIEELMTKHGARVTIENSKEETVLDKAVKWSDPRVTAKVQYKYEQVVPPMTEAELAKKKKEKQRKKSKASSARYSIGRRSATSTANKTPKPFLPPLTPQTGAGGDSAYEPESIFDTNRKQSVVLLASALSTGTKYDKEDITYNPGRWWVRLKSTDDLLKERQILRSQHTWEYDFPKTFKMPFPKHIEEKAKINDV